MEWSAGVRRQEAEAREYRGGKPPKICHPIQEFIECRVIFDEFNDEQLFRTKIVENQMLDRSQVGTGGLWWLTSETLWRQTPAEKTHRAKI